MSYGLRVFFVFPDGLPSVAHRATLAMMALLPRGHVEAVACFLGEGPLVGISRDEMGIETVLLTAARGSGAMTGGAARRAIEPVLRGARAHLVYDVGAPAHATAGALAHRMGLRVVWSQFGTASFRSLLQVRAALAPAATVLAASSVAAQRQHRVNPRRVPIEVLPPGVKIPDEGLAARRERARRALGFAAEDLVAGWVDASGPGDTALRAAASLCHARSRARLVILDDPALPADRARQEAMRTLASSLGIGERVTLAPWLPGTGPSPALDALDIAFFLPPAPAVAALAPLESLAAGVALVAADREPLREYVSPGRDAILVPPDDHEALAAALLALADDPEQRRRLAAAGTATVRDRFRVEALAKRLAKTLRGLVGPDAAPREAHK